MIHRSFVKWVAPLISLFVLTCLPTYVATAATFEKELKVSSSGILHLKTDSGSVKIVTQPRDTALVEVEIQGNDADKFEVSASTNGNSLDILGELEGKQWSSHLKVKFTVTLPETFSLDIDTAGGSIKVADISGDVNARTSGGSIKIGTVHGNVDLNTSGGSIKTEHVYGELKARTSGGSIKAKFAQQLQKDAVLHTSGGSVTAYLIEDIQVTLRASTSGGRVKSDFKVNGQVKKQSIRGDINGGGPELKIHTSGGSVNIRTL